MPLTTNQVLALEMEEASGTRLDATSHANNAAIFGVGPTRDVGKRGFAASFNGTTQGLRITYGLDFVLGTSVPFTITGWFYLNAGAITPFTSEYIVINKGPQGGSNPSWFVLVRSVASILYLSMVVHAVDETTLIFDAKIGISPIQLSEQTWYFFAAGVDDDGRQWLTVACNPKTYAFDPGQHPWIKQYTDDLTVGSGYNESGGTQNDFFPGLIDELYYWTRALTDEELGIACTGDSDSFYPFHDTPSTIDIRNVRAVALLDKYQADHAR